MFTITLRLIIYRLPPIHATRKKTTFKILPCVPSYLLYILTPTEASWDVVSQVGLYRLILLYLSRMPTRSLIDNLMRSWILNYPPQPHAICTLMSQWNKRWNVYSTDRYTSWCRCLEFDLSIADDCYCNFHRWLKLSCWLSNISHISWRTTLLRKTVSVENKTTHVYILLHVILLCNWKANSYA